MNEVWLIGILTKNPELRYTGNNDAVATMTIAVDRFSKGEKKTDFPRVIAFGKQAENCDRYLAKGQQVSIKGSIRTGSYKSKNGQTVYTTDIWANSVEFIGNKEKSAENRPESVKEEQEFIPIADDDIPF